MSENPTNEVPAGEVQRRDHVMLPRRDHVYRVEHAHRYAGPGGETVMLIVTQIGLTLPQVERRLVDEPIQVATDEQVAEACAAALRNEIVAGLRTFAGLIEKHELRFKSWLGINVSTTLVDGEVSRIAEALGAELHDGYGSSKSKRVSWSPTESDLGEGLSVTFEGVPAPERVEVSEASATPTQQTREIKARYLTAGMAVRRDGELAEPASVSVVRRCADGTVVVSFDGVTGKFVYGVEEGVTVVEPACDVKVALEDATRAVSADTDVEVHEPPADDTPEADQAWHFTFGSGLLYDGRYVVINGTYASARERMLEVFGRAWCGQYSGWGFTTNSALAGLVELPESEWPPVVADDEPAGEQEHRHVGGSAGGPGENSAECACGVTYAGFDAHAEAAELIERHVAEATTTPTQQAGR